MDKLKGPERMLFGQLGVPGGVWMRSAALPPAVAGLLPELEHYLALSLQADYNQKLKKSQTQEDITIRWGLGLNQRIAYFTLPKSDSGNEEWCQTLVQRHAVLAGGDRSCWYKGDLAPKWKGISHSTRDPDNLAMKDCHWAAKQCRSCKAVQVTHKFQVDFVWKSTSFNRMQCALKTLAVNEGGVSGHLYYQLLGHRRAGSWSASSLSTSGHKSSLTSTTESLHCEDRIRDHAKMVTLSTIDHHLAQRACAYLSSD